MWKRLSSPNILPLIGAHIGDQLVVVSEWMKNGNIKEYIQQNPHVNKLLLVNFTGSLIYLFTYSLTSLAVGGCCARRRIFA